jgi:hypothetical protein
MDNAQSVAKGNRIAPKFGRVPNRLPKSPIKNMTAPPNQTSQNQSEWVRSTPMRSNTQ